jgi:acyl-CoA synthetase (NDP forming)
MLRLASRYRDDGKRVVVILGGREPSGSRAALSHTAAISSPGAVSEQILQEGGIGTVRTPEEAVGVLQLLSSSRKRPRGRRILVFANSGGSGVLAADLAEERGLSVPLIEGEKLARIEEIIPSYASGRNPIDPTPAVNARPEVAKDLFRVAAAGDDFDAAVVCASLWSRSGVLTAHTTADTLTDTELFSVVTWFAGSDEIANILLEAGLPYISSAAVAITALATLINMESPESANGELSDRSSTLAITAEAVGVETVTEDAVEESLRASGISTARSRVVSSPSEAGAAGEELGWPVVLKGLAPQVPHRAKVGALSLGVASERAAHDEYRRIEAAISAASPSAVFGGVLVQREYAHDIEVIVGVRVDPAFGLVCAIGLGGTGVEERNAVRFGLFPMTADRAASMIAGHRALRVLSSYRRQRLSELVEQLGAWWETRSAEGVDLRELDLNPIVFDGDETVVLDALAIVGRGSWVGSDGRVSQD